MNRGSVHTLKSFWGCRDPSIAKLLASTGTLFASLVKEGTLNSKQLELKSLCSVKGHTGVSCMSVCLSSLV